MKNGNRIVLIIVIITVLFVIAAIGITSYILKNKTTTIEETEHREGLVYNKKINSITIKYYNGYNIATGDAISDTIPAFKVELKGKDLEKVSKLVKSLTYYKIPEEDGCENSKDCLNTIFDNYELIVNNEFSLYLDKEYGFVTEPYNTFKVPEDLYKMISNKVEENNKKNVYKQLNSKKLLILHGNERYEVKDTVYVEELSKYDYYKINAKDEEFKEETIEYILDLGDGRTIDLYHASVLSRMNEKDGTHYYIHSGDLAELVEKIYKNSKIKIVTENVSIITVTYQGNKYTIEDQNKINEIVNELKYLEYNDYNYSSKMSETDFGDSDIIINVNKTKYIIPGEMYIGNRYFIDVTGKVYNVSGLSNSMTEKYVKELVNYKE